MVELAVGERALLFSDGANLTYLEPGADLPDKHQLLIGFGDESCLVVSVRMYGGCGVFHRVSFPVRWSLTTAVRRRNLRCCPTLLTSPISCRCWMNRPRRKKSAKAFLATGQTIPGLGNGVLQDILYRAGMHPKTKISGLTRQQKSDCSGPSGRRSGRCCVWGGRDSETDLFGRPGGYRPRLSKKYGRGAVSPLRFPDLQGKLPGGQYLLLSRLPAAMIRREGKYGDMTIRECSDGLRNHAKRTVVDCAFFSICGGDTPPRVSELSPDVWKGAALYGAPGQSGRDGYPVFCGQFILRSPRVFNPLF